MNNSSGMTLMNLILAFTAGITLISVLIDRRRFRNGFYLLITLIVFGIWLIERFSGTSVQPFVIFLMILFIIFLIMIIPVLLIVNGFIMIHREGFHFSNLMSLLFGSLILFGEYSTFASMFGSATESRILFFISLSVIYISVIFLAFMFYTMLIMIMPHRTDFDFIIVHGCGLIQGDKVSRLLSDRLDKGIKVYHASMASVKMIVSGGKGKDETISEASAMKNYLLCHGIPEEDIILEDQSDSTMSNLVNSRKIIRSYGGRQRTALVTSNYHVLRALLYSHKIYFTCTGIGSRVAFYYWPSAMIREFVAVMKMHWVLFFSGIALFACLAFAI